MNHVTLKFQTKAATHSLILILIYIVSCLRNHVLFYVILLLVPAPTGAPYAEVHWERWAADNFITFSLNTFVTLSLWITTIVSCNPMQYHAILCNTVRYLTNTTTLKPVNSWKEAELLTKSFRNCLNPQKLSQSQLSDCVQLNGDKT